MTNTRTLPDVPYRSLSVSWLCVLASLLPYVAFGAARQISFTQDVQPILESNCLRCHNDNSAKGDLSLSNITSALKSIPELLSPDDPTQSVLLAVVTPQGAKPPEMPKKGDPLSPEAIALLKSWISQGAPWPSDIILEEPSAADRSWWAYQPLTPKAQLPAHNIDAFIQQTLATKQLIRNPPADRRTLIRRATYDLTGLPPTPEAVRAFEQDPDPRAYEKLITRLLGSPQYGERWGRHWLDVVRFGESNGYERNVIINNLWPFRDYVIQSFNEDKPFDRFIQEHLAGDIIGAGDPSTEIGTAFLVAGPFDDVGNQDAVQAAQIRANTLDEIIRATSEAFLGMTVGCARCHDHKFDPIKQSDYYQLYATFAGIRHGSATWATPKEKAKHEARLAPLLEEEEAIEMAMREAEAAILARAAEQTEALERTWIRPKIERTGVEERFDTVTARFVRLVSEGQDSNPKNVRNFNIDEFEIYSTETPPRNVALAKNGATATGEARRIEDFADAYNAGLAIDGRFGARFITTGGTLTIELAQPTAINRIYFSSARNEPTFDQGKFVFVGEYRIETSNDGDTWTPLVDSHDRAPVNQAFREHRLKRLTITQEELKERAARRKQLTAVKKAINRVPPLPTAFLGSRRPSDAEGPFHTFLGGSPQKKGPEVVPASLSTLEDTLPGYRLDTKREEGERRRSLAGWIANRQNPLTARVLVNRIWHYHFGTGIVDTPSDFGYMGGRPTHPLLLDYLAHRLIDNGWTLKALHREIMLSQTYQQASTWRAAAAAVDGDSRLLWRFPPRRLSAEEIRDTILQTSGQLNLSAGGPGFRLYKFMQDNVSTYEPLDQHGPDTYRRAVYHQNVRASVVDLMTDFDLPDCAFSTPKRAGTTSPLQALTLLNHQFTVDMAAAFAERLKAMESLDSQVDRAFDLAFQRLPDATERDHATKVVQQHGLPAFCRALLNANELIYLD